MKQSKAQAKKQTKIQTKAKKEIKGPIIDKDGWTLDVKKKR
jgi:hypothetical protein